MRRFDRLRKTARALAQKNGHDLGVFQRTYIDSFYPSTTNYIPYPTSISTNTSTTINITTSTSSSLPYTTRIYCFRAYCIRCNKECCFSCYIDLDKQRYCYRETMEAALLNTKAKENNEKLPMPKRSKGIIFGSCLKDKCGG